VSAVVEELRRRLRLAYVEGADTWTRENVGRALDDDELQGVIGRYAAR
jgi:hypothetical protein